MSLPVIALLGRKDEPTDAVEEYCRYLGRALHTHDIQLEIRRVPWEIHGWADSLTALRLQAADWSDRWVLVQYTALAWSSRGFPSKIPSCPEYSEIRRCPCRHRFPRRRPFPGTRLIDSLRRFVQIRTMRSALSLADLAIHSSSGKTLLATRCTVSGTFIPVGANLPIPPAPLSHSQDMVPTIGVFSITGGESGARETQIIVDAVRHAAQKLGKVRLSIFGRHAELRETALRDGLCGLPVDLFVEGVVDPAQAVQKLSACDLLLFIRGPISSRRSSAIAGIACGLPVIAYAGSETAAPITDAGVVLVSPDQPDDLNAALVRVLSDFTYRTDLAARSRAAYQTHFAWPAIAVRFSALLGTRKPRTIPVSF